MREKDKLVDLLRQIKEIAYNENLASYDARAKIQELLNGDNDGTETK